MQARLVGTDPGGLTHVLQSTPDPSLRLRAREMAFFNMQVCELFAPWRARATPRAL